MIKPNLREFVKAMSLEGLAIPQTSQDPPEVTGVQGFSLEDKADFWAIRGVSYRNGIYQVDLSKTLLPTGTQAQHAERRKQALETDSYYVPDFPLFHASINALYQNRDGRFKDEINRAKTSLAALINNKWLITLTRPAYNPDGTASLTHNYDHADSYQKIVSNFVGPDGDITGTANAQELLQALLDTRQTPQEISQVYAWLRGLPSRLWRVNAKPENRVESTAGFVADSDGSDFDCGRIPVDSDSGLGVRARKIE